MDSFSNPESGFSNYNIFKYDRYSATNNCLRGGGVFIGCVPVSDLNIEYLFIRISFGLSSFIVGGVYIPPKSPFSSYESH